MVSTIPTLKQAVLVGESFGKRTIYKNVRRTLDRINAESGNGEKVLMEMWQEMDKMAYYGKGKELPAREFVKSFNKIRGTSAHLVFHCKSFEIIVIRI